LINVVDAVNNKGLRLVRSKCDKFDEKPKKTLSAELIVDKNLVQSWNIILVKDIYRTTTEK